MPQAEESTRNSAANPPPSSRHERVVAAPTPSKATPDSLIKHTDIVDDIPDSNRFVSVSRTLFENPKEESTVHANAREHEMQDSGTDQECTRIRVDEEDLRRSGGYQTDDVTDNNPRKTIVEQGEKRRDVRNANPRALTPNDDSTEEEPHIQATRDNSTTLQSIFRAHRVEILALQAQHETAVEALKQKNAGSTAFWERKNEDDCEKLTVQNAQLQDRNTQLEQALAEHVEIFGTELSRFNEEKQSLQNQVRTLEAERDARATFQTTGEKAATEHAESVQKESLQKKSLQKESLQKESLQKESLQKESLQKENQVLRKERERHVKTILRLNENVQYLRCALEQEEKAAR